MRRTDDSVKLPGSTVLEILIVLAVIVVLIVMLLSMYEGAQRKAWATICQQNERQIGQALQLYVADNDGYWPVASAWRKDIHAYVSSQIGVLTCPMAPDGTGPISTRGVGGYAFNSALSEAHADTGEETPVSEVVIIYPSTTVSVCEQAAGIVSASGPDPYKVQNKRSPRRQERGWLRHSGGANYLFCDSHVRWYRPEAVGYNDGVHGNDGYHPTFALGAKR